MEKVILQNDDGVYIGRISYIRWCGDGYAVELVNCYKISGEEFPVYFKKIHLNYCTKVTTVDKKLLEIMKSFFNIDK